MENFLWTTPNLIWDIYKYPRTDIINKIELTKKDNLISYYGISLKKNIQIKKQLLNTYVRFEKLNNKILKFFRKIKFSNH